MSRCDPDEHWNVEGKKSGKRKLKENRARLVELQRVLYAESKRSLLVILQAMDAGGKDGTIRHVFGSVNPQGCRVTSFKAPTSEELDHDFLWRVHKVTPKKGEIGIFNRSHYEDVLIVRVHGMVPKSVWQERYDHINAFERLLAANDTIILKFFLHISEEEQKERFQERLDRPEKNWKANPKDFEERKYWQDYMAAYQEAIERCSQKWAPWFIIPANRKWFRNVAISEIVLETLEKLELSFPEPEYDLTRFRLE